MKVSDLREMTEGELLDLEKELAQQLFTLRLQKTTQGQLDNPAKMQQAKKDIARVLTVLREQRAS